MKKNKAIKIPKIFKKGIKKEHWDTRWLKYLEQLDDKSFFESCFTEIDGKMYVRKDIDVKHIKRLKKLKKAIKSNKGFVKTGPLIAVSLLVSGLVVFGLFFIQPTVEKIVIASLQAVFNAKAELSGTKLSLKNFSIKFDSLKVADKDEPMTNLFETGRISFALSPHALFRGKIYIEEAVADSILLGTARTESGALPDKPAKPKKEKPPKPQAPPLIDFQNFDAMDLLEQEYSKLTSPKLYFYVADKYAETEKKWEIKIKDSTQKVYETRDVVNQLLAIDPRNIKSIEQLTESIETLNSAIQLAKDLATEAQDITKELDKDYKEAEALLYNAKQAVNEDTAYLLDLVNPKSGAAIEALEPQIQALLSEKAEKYLYYASKIWDLYQEHGDKFIKPDSQKKTKASPKGRTVYFPSTNYPIFRLGVLQSSFTINNVYWFIQIKEVSSEPKLVSAPSSLEIKNSFGSMYHTIFAELDLRIEPQWHAVIDASGYAIDLGSSLKALGLNGVTGVLSGSGTVAGRSNEEFEMGSKLILAKPNIKEPVGTFGFACAQALELVDAIDIEVLYSKIKSKDSFKAKTNLDSIVSTIVTSMVEQYIEKAKKELLVAFNNFIEKQVLSIISTEELDALVYVAKNNNQIIENFRKEIEQRKKDFEQEIKKETERVLKQKAEELLEKIDIPLDKIPQIDELEKLKEIPNIKNIPKIPSLPKF